jgi:hypothetical protein
VTWLSPVEIATPGKLDITTLHSQEIDDRFADALA